ncbi:Tetratricopeptide repeat protein [Gimesia chilikensis]|uniref:Tetratricopeptide repeat protein n=1 Tax=Gimesia chilikensis TaxID=2605989 RepID=A0A517W7P9_9PLAN|nr:multiheme c-type cytochrome [Gimesia chilikensis]QDU01278.1 Tetratricopeptide repeat protein [Gimesia chilikensis]
MATTDTSVNESRPRRIVRRAVGPKLRKVLYLLFFLVALLGANSIYLVSITTYDWLSGETLENWFYQYMFLAHLILGLVLLAPFILFGIVHIYNTKNRLNRRAVRVGYGLFIISCLVLISGLLLLRIGSFDLKNPTARSITYWCHVIAPIFALWLYWLHRLVGPKIRWKAGLSYMGVITAMVIGMLMFHSADPRKWNVVGPESGEKYFFPSLARTSTGDFIPSKALMMDDYCKKCHPDTHKDWSKSVHRFSSFNNPTYLASVRETRKVAFERDGNLQASRFCAGCHDPVPFFSGAFDDPNFDDINHITAQAGITCTTCHAITHVNSVRGNSDYTIEEPIHYPFAYSDNPFLQWVNNQLVKAKPEFHKKTFLKDFHKSTEFCGTCHKVHLPEELNQYKFLRGQNHYDSFLLSGVSGHGARSFYYPPKAQENCNKCHMPAKESNDFGARHFYGAKELSVHNHLFPAANTGIAALRGDQETVAVHQEFLKDNLRVDFFGIREEGSIEGKLTAPLRPEVPTLKPGQKYLLETVLRTLKVGHHFTQGTADSNEIWLDVTVKSGDRIIGRSGSQEADGTVDPWSHFVNAFVIDREGNRIDRRNAQDIFVALYNNQMPPGAGQTVHYELNLPDDLTEPVTVEAKLLYRKFDTHYMQYVASSLEEKGQKLSWKEPGVPYVNTLPITTIASDTITFPVEGVEAKVENKKVDIPEWQRWNDYGIGLFLKGKAELRQAAEAFSHVDQLGRYDGSLNLARVYFREGRLQDAVEALQKSSTFTDPPAPPWTLAWLSGKVNQQQGHLEEAEKNYRSVLEDQTEERTSRGFDFSKDYVVINDLGQNLFDQAKRFRTEANRDQRDQLLNQAVDQFQKTLVLDPENVTAHYNLSLIYDQLGKQELSEEHRNLHLKYKVDDTARGFAERKAREKYPAANHAAEQPVIYSLHRKTETKPNATALKD